MKRVEPFIFALFSKVGSGLPHEQKQVRIIAPQECIVKNDDYKPMEAFIFSLFLIHAANCPDSPLGIKRKMRFLHQPDFSRIDRGKNREISDWTNGLGEKFIFLQPIELPYNEIQRI